MQITKRDFLIENKRVLILLVGLLVILLLFISVHLPLSKGFANKGYRIYQLAKKYNSLDEIEQEIQSLRKYNRVLLGQSQITNSQGQKPNKLSNIMNLLNSKLKENSLVALSIKPQQESQEKDFLVLPFELELYGRYHSFGEFLSDIESSVIPLRVTEFEMNSRDNVSVNLDFKLKLNAYLIKG